MNPSPTPSTSSRRAGRSTRDMADRRYRSRVQFLLLAAGVALVLLLVANNADALGVGGAGFLVLIILARIILNWADARAGRMQKEERRAVRGAKAEERIGLILEVLGDDYLVLHDVESSYGNIDHIVIRRDGSVFLLETKSHGGRVSVAGGRLLVNGNEPEKYFIGQTLRNTYWLKECIRVVIHGEVWITPVIVFTNSFVERTSPIKGVATTNKRYLLDLLQRPSGRAANPAVWEGRGRIQDRLYGRDTMVELASDEIDDTEVVIDTDQNASAVPVDETEGETAMTMHREVPAMSVSASPRCPTCGGEMVLRTARRGPNQGRTFWGCASFPRCCGIVGADTPVVPDEP